MPPLLCQFVSLLINSASFPLSHSSSTTPSFLFLLLHHNHLTTQIKIQSREINFLPYTFSLCSCHSTIGCQCISSSCCPFDLGFLFFGAGRTAYFDHGGISELMNHMLPYSIRILLESAIRNCDEFQVTSKDVENILDWENTSLKHVEIQFKPARLLLQFFVGVRICIMIIFPVFKDFTGVPVVLDLATMRDAMRTLGGDNNKIDPLVPIIDHSVQADVVRSEKVLEANMELEFQHNKERFSFLKWGSNAFHNMLVVPPSSGIVHQVNLEYLGRVVFNKDDMFSLDTVVGTDSHATMIDALGIAGWGVGDSHATMIDALGIAGWGVGGIEAEAVMLGQTYKSEGNDTIILAGAAYGTGSSRDWTAKGPMLLTLGLTGRERYTIDLPSSGSEMKPGQDIPVSSDNGKSFTCNQRFDTEVELAYFDHGASSPLSHSLSTTPSFLFLLLHHHHLTPQIKIKSRGHNFFYFVLSPYVCVTQLLDVNAFLPLVALLTWGSFCLVQVERVTLIMEAFCIMLSGSYSAMQSINES
ncbi:hypothetical protein RHMOL_Rhmol10G0296000 [Rhododendron molle]|uniref:Uncharacterized protein n=1 Tax=Rhododendron molle TaxID=49168 RepID=A0ACC0M8P2_RHOML|nr:hypothetical protein RHMOL_Rhmol10G0296000 [Rhododendron molle]